MMRHNFRRELEGDSQVSGFRKLEAAADRARRKALPARDIPGVVALVRAGNLQATGVLRDGLEWIVYEVALKDAHPEEWVGLFFAILDKTIISLPTKPVSDVVRKVRADCKRAAREQSDWQQRNRIWQRGRGNAKYPRKCLRRSWVGETHPKLHRSDRSECRPAHEIAAAREAAERYASKWYDTWDMALCHCQSPREFEIVRYAADGNDPGDIARMIHTSRRHVESILDSVVARLYWATGSHVCYGNDPPVPDEPGASRGLGLPEADRRRLQNDFVAV